MPLHPLGAIPRALVPLPFLAQSSVLVCSFIVMLLRFQLFSLPMLKFSTTNAYVNHTVMATAKTTLNEPPRHSTSLFPPWSSSSVHHPNQVLRLDLGSFFLFAHDYVIGYNTQPTYSNTIYLKWCQKTVGLVSPCKPYVLTPGTANVHLNPAWKIPAGHPRG